MKKFLYLLLNIFSGYVELGVILYTLSLQYSPLKIIGIALAFQIGNLVPVPIHLNKLSIYFSLMISIIFILFSYTYHKQYFILFIGILFLSVAIQLIRYNCTEKTSTTLKRISRVTGFIIAPIFSIFIILFVLFLLFVCTIMLNAHNKKIFIIKPKLNFYNITMIIHQMHYFCYTYFIIIILHNLMKFSSGLICIFFTLVWITYITTSHFFNKNTYKKYFVIGHLFLFVILGLMYFNFSKYLTVVLWICTGFGAGTIFALNRLNKKFIPYDENAMEYSENIGHILGILLSLLLYAIDKNVFLPIAGAAALVLFAAGYFHFKTIACSST
jgi:hypothetical protein